MYRQPIDRHLDSQGADGHRQPASVLQESPKVWKLAWILFGSIINLSAELKVFPAREVVAAFGRLNWEVI